MPRRQNGYTPLQEFFLLRVARLSRLRAQYREHAIPPNEDMALVHAALRSTLVDCTELGVGPEAHALLDAQEKR